MATGKKIPHLELEALVNAALARVGADNEQARIFSSALVWSDLIGRPTHGVWRLPTYLKRIEAGLINCPCNLEWQDTDGAALNLDGGNGLGHYVGHAAMNRAINLAGNNGIGAVGVRNSNHFGAGAYFVNLAAKRGMIGIAVSNSLARMAPHGGVKKVFGTNPIAFAAPSGSSENILFDAATSALCGADVMRYAEAGQPMPPGMAVNAQGDPIQDPQQINSGAMLPFGGAKGSGIALLVELLSCILTGASFSSEVNSMFSNFEQPGGNGHFFLAIDIARFMEPRLFTARVQKLCLLITNSGIAPGTVSVPGDRRWQEYKRNLREGIAVPDDTLAAIRQLAERPFISHPAAVATTHIPLRR